MHQARASEEAETKDCQERGNEPELHWLADINIDLIYTMHVGVHPLDTTLQKSLLFPLVTKTQDGFLAEMSLSASSIHVESPNHYSAHTSADDCTDDVTGQFYTTATKTGVDAMVS